MKRTASFLLGAALLLGAGLTAPATLAAGAKQTAAEAAKACAQTDPDAVIEGCTRVLALARGLPAGQAASIYRTLGRAYGLKGDYDRALANLDKAIELDPGSAPAFDARGSVLDAKGDSARAMRDFNEAIRLDPGHLPAYQGRGTLYLDAGDNDRAIADFDVAARDPNAGEDLYRNRGIAFSRKNDFERAIRDFNQAIRLAPQAAPAYASRGRVYWAKADYDRALADLDQAIRLDPQSAAAYQSRGIVRQARNDLDGALADFDQAIRLDAGFALAYHSRAIIHALRKDYARAIPDYDEALRLSPADAVALNNRGEALRLSGKPDRAVADYSEAIRLDPKSGVAYNGRAIARLDQNDVAGAEVDFRAATAADPTPDTFTEGLAEARARLQARTAVAAAGTSVTAQRRVALVIGNSAYAIGALANPGNDAADVSAKLRSLGFDVVTGLDLSLSGFAEIMGRFTQKAAGADAALVYYSGHAMQVEGENWLMPVDARADSVFDVKTSTVSLQALVGEVQARAKTSLFFLDACRNNPIADALAAKLKAQNRAFGQTRGLARIEVGSPDTLVVFATQAGDVAADGNGRNSPFTEAFLENIATPGVEIETLMKRVSAAVEAKTASKQEPERLSRLKSEFYFVPAR